ncbi:hypothetical protein I4U23_031400 [Adineta vaga]|nr:hypothetical protein I4U23_031400 [Adineta vaga]
MSNKHKSSSFEKELLSKEPSIMKSLTVNHASVTNICSSMATSTSDNVPVQIKSGTISAAIDVNDKNYESFALIWLDVDSKKAQNNIEIQDKLREVFDYIRVFDSVELFLIWLDYRCKRDMEKVILIISGQLSEEVLLKIHDYSQLVAIYVFGTNLTTAKDWSKKFGKIYLLAEETKILVDTVKSYQRELDHLEDISALPITVYNSSTSSVTGEESSSNLNAEFMWFQLLIEIIVQMNHTNSDRHDLLELCRKAQAGNIQQLQLIEEFQQNCRTGNALSWYTRESCFYRMLNKALRCKDFDTLIAFRSFVTDLHAELKYLQGNTTSTSITKVYRFQLISKEELDRIKSSVGKYISMNSFLSTTLDQNYATALLSSTTSVIYSELEPILLEITIDPSLRGAKPFADISSQSYFQVEKEVLFMLGIIFKIEEVVFEQSTTVKLSLADENASDLKELSSYLRTEMQKFTPTLTSLGVLLCQMGEYEKSEKCYQHRVDQLKNKNSMEISGCYRGLGNVAHERGDYDLAIHYHQMALKVDLNQPENDQRIASNYHNLAIAYVEKNDFENASEYNEKCLKIEKKIYGSDSIRVASTYLNMGCAYDGQEKYSDALMQYNDALQIQEKHLPPNHPEIANTLSNIGFTHYKLKAYSDALNYFEKSLAKKLISLPATHGTLGIGYHNLGLVYESTNELKLALENYLKADQIYRISLPRTHSHRVELQQNLISVKTKLNI